jgi:hypothetical protein
MSMLIRQKNMPVWILRNSLQINEGRLAQFYIQDKE